MSTLGRNEPCHCGSGRKYKKCHWNEDQQKARERAQRQREHESRLEALGHPSDQELRAMYQKMTGRPAPTGPLPTETVALMTEMWQEDRLADEAMGALDREAWAAHFEQHPDEFDSIAETLADDPRFDTYELTNENIRKVRDELGALPEEEEARAAFADEAIRLSLDAEDRDLFARAVRALVPDLVDEERHKEAYVAALCAERVLDPEATASPFLRDVVARSLQPEGTP